MLPRDSNAPSARSRAARGPLIAPLVGLALGAAIALSGRHFSGVVIASTCALGLALEVLSPTLSARVRDALARGFTALILGAAYVALFTPLRVLRRGDPLRLTLDRDAKSYWTPRDARRDLGRPY